MDKLINAFVLGAGLGTRLRPLTGNTPKPLIPICQKPLITFAFDRLIEAGITRFVVNTHHSAEAYAVEFPGSSYRGTPIDFRHEEVLLETAGGIKNVEDLLGGEPFVIYNGDVLCDLPVEEAIRRHFEAGNEVTMVLRSSGGPLQVAFDEGTGRVVDIAGRLGAAPGKYLFTGIYVIDPAFFARIPPATKISVIPIFLDMIRSGGKLGGIVLEEGGWWDLGTRGQYLAAHQRLAGAAGLEWVHPTARIGSGVTIEGATVLGAGSEVGDGVTLKDCILWKGAKIASGSLLERCIITTGKEASGVHTDADF
jgi:NDP-sugar pyrophosphorylase family protein